METGMNSQHEILKRLTAISEENRSLKNNLIDVNDQLIASLLERDKVLTENIEIKKKLITAYKEIIRLTNA